MTDIYNIWVKGECPACGGRVFVGDGGMLVCAGDHCKDRFAPHRACQTVLCYGVATMSREEIAAVIREMLGKLEA